MSRFEVSGSDEPETVPNGRCRDMGVFRHGTHVESGANELPDEASGQTEYSAESIANIVEREVTPQHEMQAIGVQ
jgi:hypothetical protein